jgi:hypothetical protein
MMDYMIIRTQLNNYRIVLWKEATKCYVLPFLRNKIIWTPTIKQLTRTQCILLIIDNKWTPIDYGDIKTRTRLFI